jgi:ATP-dependent Clp protease protease subunit
VPEQDDWKPDDRYLYLVGEITDEQTQEILRRLVQNWRREFLLVINSDGGSCHNALAIANLIRQHGRVDTLCVGVAESGAADCLAAGRRRYIVPGSIAMIHQVSWELGREVTANLTKSAYALERLNSLLAGYLAEATGKSREQLDRDMTTDHYLFDQEIIDYGLADAYWDPADLLPPPPATRRSRLRAETRHSRPKAD